MKKSMILLLVLLIAFTISKKGEAASYKGFQEINLREGKLLREFSNEDYDYYYPKVNKRKMFGWRIKIINKDVKAKYISETIFSYYNDGSSPLTYNYTLENNKTQKFGMDTSGSIGCDLSSSGKGFKNGLNAKLGLDLKNETSLSSKEKTELKVTVDPHSTATLRIVGEGLLTNGVAANYCFWIRSIKGGFEYFIVTTEYPRLEILTL